jgi:rSAM/selenodomain-associated transferase 2
MLSVIIPTLNEAAALPGTISHTLSASRGSSIELIVSDCGSTDGTRSIASDHGIACLDGAMTRAGALNRGAARASGEVLLFLHADTLLPDDFARRTARALEQTDVVGGAFEFKFAPHPQHRGLNRYGLMLVTVCNRIRYRWTRNYYGDQAIFVRRDVFERVGGFPDAPLFEDLRFASAMNRLGRTAILSPAACTSPRRFIANGIVRQLARDTLMLACESFGVRPISMWRDYNRFNQTS